jgi:hypothetical protein
VPTIDYFDGISINIYFGEHAPPYVHALYNEFEALIEIKSKRLYAGHLPSRQMTKVVRWLAENEDEILEIFYQFNEKLR